MAASFLINVRRYPLASVAEADLRVVPHGNTRTSLSHTLSDRVSNAIRSTSDNYDLAGHPELLDDIGRRVWERTGEAVSDLGAVLYSHRHFDGDVLESR